jgi:hypothetical protein
MRKRRTVIKNLSLKLAVKVMIEIKALFRRIRPVIVEIIRDIRDV